MRLAELELVPVDETEPDDDDCTHFYCCCSPNIGLCGYDVTNCAVIDHSLLGILEPVCERCESLEDGSPCVLCGHPLNGFCWCNKCSG